MSNPLRKRKKGIYRQIPLPSNYISDLQSFIVSENKSDRIWDFSRSTGSRYIKKVMKLCGLTGKMACAKGLRHLFCGSLYIKRNTSNSYPKMDGALLYYNNCYLFKYSRC